MIKKVKSIIQNSRFLILTCNFTFYILHFTFSCYAQQPDLEWTVDLDSNTVALPKIFRPNIDISGRGGYEDESWPQSVAAKETLDLWQKEMGFSGLYRLQYNLWQIQESAKDKDKRDRLLANYENIIKMINESGGVVLLDLFATPAGLGRVLDKRSPALDLKAFKELVKSHIRELSCNKKYNIWYEVWSAPDLDDFFLGRQQEYLGMYRAVAEAVKELEQETKINIPLGGPSVSWWFQNCDGNSIVNAEGSLIYNLIKHCYHYRLPLDFITWHAYSTAAKSERESTLYNNKTTSDLIKEWLSYFHFDKDIPLIISEWNYDSGPNTLSGRGEKANIAGSFIPCRLKNMAEAGVAYQLFFCLEDFRANKEGVVRNVGIFSWDGSKTEPKALYNVFKMLSLLGGRMFVVSGNNDEFAGLIASGQDDTITLLIYNYIDPGLAQNYLSRNIASLSDNERRFLLGLVKSDELGKIMSGKTEINGLRATNRMKSLLKKAQELNDAGERYKQSERYVKLNIVNLKGSYSLRRYIVDEKCGSNCGFVPAEEKEISGIESYCEILAMAPYSAQLIVLEKK